MNNKKEREFYCYDMSETIEGMNLFGPGKGLFPCKKGKEEEKRFRSLVSVILGVTQALILSSG